MTPLLALPLALLLCAAAPAPAADEDVIARAGALAVTGAQLRARLDAMGAAGATSAQPDALVEDLLNEALLAEEAARAGMSAEPEVTAAAERTRRRLAGERLVALELARSATLDEGVLRAMYHDTGDQADLSMLVVASREDAQALVAKLADGAEFATLAPGSLDPRVVERGGRLGSMSRGQMPPAVREVAFTAPLGRVQGPVQLELGWGVVRVEAREVVDEAGFQARREALKGFAEEQVLAQVKQHYVAQLRKQSGVVLDEPFLRSTGVKVDLGPAGNARAVATVKGRAVPFEEVVAEMRRTFGNRVGGHFSGPAVKSELAWSIVDRLLLEDAAIERGLGTEPGIVAAGRRAERDALVRAWGAKLRAAVPAPPPKDVEAAYAAARADLRRPGRRTCSHVVAASRAEALRLKARVGRPDSFEDVARDYSQDTSTAARGGLLGELTDDRLEALATTEHEAALADAIRRARPGEVTDPVQSRAGWHLVLCGAATPPSVVPFEEAAPALTARLAAERGDAAVRERIAELRSRARLSVDRSAVQRVMAAHAAAGVSR